MDTSSDSDPWTLIITPRRGWLDLRLGELWRYRDLVYLFVRRDFVAVYKQTILGPLWYLVKPLLTTLTFTVIFGNIAGLPTDGLPQFLFYMAGTVAWGYFAECLGKTSDTFGSNAYLFGRVHFPRLVSPLSGLISGLVTFGIQFGLFLAFALYFGLRGSEVRPNAWALLLPLLLAIMAGLGMGAGLLISALTIRYRDLRYLVGFGVQLLMYATPVIYPVSAIPEAYRWLVRLNPLSAVMEAFRYGWLGAGSASMVDVGYALAVMLVVLAGGVVLFNRAEATFLDTI